MINGYFYFILLIFTWFNFFECYASNSLDQVLKEAKELVEIGDQTEDFAQRKLAYNQALSLYVQVSKKVEYSHLDQAIGQLYYRLAEYPLAILYFERALKKGVSYSKIRLFYEEAHLNLGLDSPTITRNLTWRRIFTWNLYSWIVRYKNFFLLFFFFHFLLL